MNFFKRIEGIITLEDKFNYVKNHEEYNRRNEHFTIANNIKIYNLGLTSEQIDKAYKVLDYEYYYQDLETLMNDYDCVWNKFYKKRYQIYNCGRSGGYLVVDIDREDLICKSALNYIYGYEFGVPAWIDIFDKELHDNEFELLKEYCYGNENYTLEENKKQFEYDIEDDFDFVIAFDEYCDLLRSEFIGMCEDKEYLKNLI